MPNLQFANTDPNELALDHAVTVNPLTGSANLTIPLHLSPGRAGFGPAFSLDYDSSAGNSPFGVGWSLNGLLTIGINTRKHLPRYDGKDDFVFGAVGELVPSRESSPNVTVPTVTDAGAFWIRRYQARFENGFLCVEQWLEKATGRIHWRTRDARNVLTIYGLRDDGSSRIADPLDPQKVFLWLPDGTYDAKGNAIQYEYLGENGDGIDRSQSFERSRRSATAQRYLKRVRYGNSAPVLTDAPDQAPVRWAFETVFDYGDHTTNKLPSPLPDQTWDVRPDPFSTFRPGFEVRTYRLCRRILEFHNFSALSPEPSLTGAYDLDYDLNPAGATLKSVTYTGHRLESSTGERSEKSLPPLVMTYTVPSIATSFRSAPVESLDNVPYAFVEPQFRWIDLFGEGLPGLLTESAGGWFYHANRGAGEFAPLRNVTRQPALSLADAVLSDFNADGNTDVAVLHGRTPGYYEFNRDSGEWQNFRYLPQLPHLESAATAQWMDLNGDGRSDLVLTSPSQVLWFPSQEHDGFGDAVVVDRQEETGGQAPLNRDLLLDYFFADMNGDGLIDQVRVQNGRVEYWPQLGNGAFGESILMEDSPVFASTGQFDPSRVLLVDLDGTGGADIVYLGEGEVRYWINAEGNRLLEGGTIRNLPYIEASASAQIIDFLCDGTPCLVWCSAVASEGSAIQYLPLTNGIKPRLLLSVNNSLGMEITLEYSTSASHYLRDQKDGRPWRTKIPTHPVVVDRKEIFDAIGGNRTTTRFAYHDGYYDSVERLFAGFALVDQYDADAPDPATKPLDVVLTTPCCLRTWFFQGYPCGAIPSDSFQGDPNQVSPEPLVFEDPAGLSPRDFCDGWRATRGLVRRQELFALSSAEGSPVPFEVTIYSYRVRCLEPSIEDREGAFFVFRSEELEYTYEQAKADPRTRQDLTLEVDSFGNPTLACSVAYPRRSSAIAVSDAQRRTLVSARKQSFLHFDTASRHEIAIPLESQEFEISGVLPPKDGILSWDALRVSVETALVGPLAFDQDFASGMQSKLIGWSRNFYWRDSADVALPFGQAGAPALLHHAESACFTPTWAKNVWGARVDKNLLQNDGLYVLKDGYCWQTGETWVWNAPSGFYQLASMQRVQGATVFHYDPDFLHITEIVDPVGNISRAEIDYNLPAPFRIVDQNNNTSEVRYDALGVVAVSTSYGTILDGNGNPQAYGNDPLASYVPPPTPSFDNVLTNPAAFVQNASEFTYYELDTWATTAVPPRFIRLVREQHVHDGTGSSPVATRVQVAVVHSDGFRNILQSKLLTEPGPALARDARGHLVLGPDGAPVEGPEGPRWLASGYTLYNRKQLPVRRYEPFYCVTPLYESELALQQFGVFREYQYDALSRPVRESLPNGTFLRTEHSAWEITAFDANDTVLDSQYKVLRDGLPSGNPEKMALMKAEAHANTPVRMQLNANGIEIRRVTSAAPGDDRFTEAIVDIAGRTTAMIDSRGLTSFQYSLDMLGRMLAVHSIDAGDRLIVLDIYNRPVHQWDALGTHEQRVFDVMSRPISLVMGGTSPDHLVQQFIYGEDPSIPEAQLRNLRGHVAVIRDEAGALSHLQCDPDGQILRSTRQFRGDYKGDPDWANPGTVSLDPQTYTTSVSFDAFGRVSAESLPDGTTRQLEYLQGGGLAKISITSNDGKLQNIAILSGTDYNAHGERTKAILGNGVEVLRTFDAETFLVSRIAATRKAPNPVGADVSLQDLRYTYDPAGNIVYSVDQAQMPPVGGGFLQGLNVSPESEYTYDALYQLTENTGRVHQALLENDCIPGAPGATKGTRHLAFNNGAAVERYKRTYDYDLAGNLKSISHRGVTSNWKSSLWISATSNRSLPATDAAGNPVNNPESRFDANGNCIYFPHLREVDWNYRRNLARAVVIDRTGTGNPDDAEYYVYDHDGNRIRKITETFVSGQLQTNEVIYLRNCEIKRIRLGGRTLLERLTSRISDETGSVALVHRWTTHTGGLETDDTTKPRTRFELTNHLGSSLLELDESGAVISYEEYFPYGGTAFLAGDDAREVQARVYRFCGKERDDTTGLYYFGYRYYAPWIGRWISPDPIGPKDDLNLYRYVKNNPVCFYDPDGLQTVPRGHKEVLETEQAPPKVLEKWGKLSPEDRANRVREGRDHWKVDVKTGRVEFLSLAEVQRQEQEQLKQGKNIREYIVKPKQQQPQRKTEHKKSEQPSASDEAQENAKKAQVKRDPEAAAPTDDPGSKKGQEVDGSGGGTKGAGGEDAGSEGKKDAADTDATGVHAGDGTSTENSNASGGGDGGIGPGAGTKGPGEGGGGQQETETSGAQGTGTGTGTLTGAQGTGKGQFDYPGTDPPADTPAGTGSDAGIKGGTGTEPQTNTLLPPSDGSIPAPPGQTVNGTGPKGSLTGSLTGTSSEEEYKDKTGVGNGTSLGGKVGGQAGGSASGERTTGHKLSGWSTVVKVAGWTNLEFKHAKDGTEGGIPGGTGSGQGGTVWQSLYVVVSAINTVLMFVGGGAKAAFAGLKAGLKTAFVRIAELFTKEGLEKLGARIAALFTEDSLRAIGRFFWDPRTWREVSQEYWAAHGPASGRSLHHWLFPRKWDLIPQGFRNAGFNLLEMPGLINFRGGLNSWMGFAQRWFWMSGARPWTRLRGAAAYALDWAIKAAIPGSLYGAYKAGEHVGNAPAQGQPTPTPANPR